ncbi:hypothetical protein QZH41_005232 [Actinostola sp. cb2023]|nr:hypothetical protein QZH41_005232 [Actinostola sp. cb2023]
MHPRNWAGQTSKQNPVAEKAIQELENELLRLDPLGGSISSVTLAIATATLNARIRSRGLFAWEMWMQRDQFSNHQIPLSDQELVLKQHDLRNANHPYSEKSKALLKPLTLLRSGGTSSFTMLSQGG